MRDPHSAVVVICPSCLAEAATPGSLLADKVKGQKTAGLLPSLLEPKKINRSTFQWGFFEQDFFLSSEGSSVNPAEPSFRIGSSRLFLFVCYRLGNSRHQETEKLSEVS